MDTMKVLLILFSKQVNWYQVDGFQEWVHVLAPLNSQWLVLRIGGTDFLHHWVADSLWLEYAESMITKR